MRKKREEEERKARDLAEVSCAFSILLPQDCFSYQMQWLVSSVISSYWLKTHTDLCKMLSNKVIHILNLYQILLRTVALQLNPFLIDPRIKPNYHIKLKHH